MKRLKEPVVQFGALAVILFGYYGLVAEPENPIAESREVEISQTDVKLLISAFEATWKRPPSRSELDSLVEDNIREEVLVREALAPGLNGGAVIRNRLRQKLAFIGESAARSVMPTDEDLQGFLDDRSERFSRPAQVAFQQFDLGQGASGSDIAEVLEKLWQRQDVVGQPSLLPGGMPLAMIAQPAKLEDVRDKVQTAFGLLVASGAQAHELDPGYLQIQPMGKETWRVFWRKPLARGAPMPITARLPDTRVELCRGVVGYRSARRRCADGAFGVFAVARMAVPRLVQMLSDPAAPWCVAMGYAIGGVATFWVVARVMEF